MNLYKKTEMSESLFSNSFTTLEPLHNSQNISFPFPSLSQNISPPSPPPSPIHMYNTPFSKIEITNTKIVNFYNSHPNINIDEINLYFISIIDKFSSENKELTSSTILSNIPRENFDKIQIQPYFMSILSKIYPTAEIIDNKDFMFIKRMQKSKILLKNFDINVNVSNEEVDLFNNFIDKENCCGIILSQKSGISNKNHYQIDIRNRNIIVYLHNANYSQNMITSAIDIIDNLYVKIKEFSKEYDENYKIPKEVLDVVNSEYQLFINQKNIITDMVKEYSKKLLAQIDECRFSCLGTFLSEKYCRPVQNIGFNCTLCNNYSANNLKALAAHKRGCIRKNRTLTI